MDLMRKRGTGWVHSRVVEGKMVVLLAQQFKKEGGKILLARRLKKAVACGGDEAAGCGYVVEYGDEAEGVVDDAELLEEDKVDDGDEGWLVQVVGGGSAGDGAKKVPVKKKVWWQHRPIIMGSVGKRLLSIKPADLAGALAAVGAAGVLAAGARLFFFAYSTGQTVAERRSMIGEYKKEYKK